MADAGDSAVGKDFWKLYARLGEAHRHAIAELTSSQSKLGEATTGSGEPRRDQDSAARMMIQLRSCIKVSDKTSRLRRLFAAIGQLAAAQRVQAQHRRQMVMGAGDNKARETAAKLQAEQRMSKNYNRTSAKQ
ncbi:hypothetical protein AK812_SmicGene15567 [Symbiodinium microadriaticum]|uniref:Uncharacterized protein n=1 Tax=Symbiodinium microadriaticum TaxID=2951 RepID=A0A1Q9E2N7_SYMMI|nr:hypothetical protein AK812_SmicGene15567 [Symbiodinium microadriaticum]